MRPQILIQRVNHVADLQILGRFHGAGEFIPENMHHRAPFGTTTGDFIKLFLHGGGEAGIHVFLEKPHQEGGDHAPQILRNKTPFFERDIFQILQALQDGGIGGRPANAEFFQALHQ